MKKVLLPLFLVFFTCTLSAQVTDSTQAADTVATDTTINNGDPAGGGSETDAVEEDEADGNEQLRRLRAMREEKEQLSAKVEDAVAYPLELEGEDLSSFQVLDSIAENARFIFNGEDHRVEKLNTVLETRMMKYLHGKGYRYYLMEAGWATAWMVNKYIVDADSAAEQILGTYYSRNFFNMFRSLKEMNDTLAEPEKIRAVGLDIERDAPLALRTMMLMLPAKQAPDSLEMFVESLKILSSIHVETAIENTEKEEDDGDMFDFGGFEFEFNYEDAVDVPKYFYFSMVNTVKDLTTRFRAHEGEFKTYLGDGYADFERVIKEMENWLIWIEYERQELPQSWVYREQYMEGNFRRYFTDKPEAKGFGQFGRCHITRVTKVGDCGFAFFSSLNKRIITKMPELENKLVSIGIFYGGLTTSNRVNDNGNIQDLIDQTEKGTANLFMDLKDYGDEMLQTKYSAIIVAKSNKEYEEATDFVLDYENNEWVPKKKRKDYFVFDFTYTQREVELKPLFMNLGMTQPDLLTNYEFSFSSFIDRRIIRISGGWMETIEHSIPSGSYKLSGGSFRYAFGYDLFRAKNIDFAPEIGLGYLGLRLREDRTDLTSPGVGTNYRTEVTNPAFIVDGRLNLAFLIRPFYIGGFVGYTQDLSKKSWLDDDRAIPGLPKTSLSGTYFGANVGFYFYD